MTLCTAWIRQEKENQELVFATDSTLTGGEKWNHGIKLFELPRKDCMICFAGETYRAYPLILNLISILKQDKQFHNPSLDLQDVLYGIVDVFSELVNSIFEKPIGDNSDFGSEAKFLFGGWSWQQNRFRIWKIFYSKEINGFAFKEETSEEEKSRFCVFLGDPETGDRDIARIAKKKYEELLIKKDKFDAQLDMEPVEVLIEMSRDKGMREVDGSIQIGKIYKSGNSELFGVFWPSIDGKPNFLGKNYEPHNKPNIKFYDPDTCFIIDEKIPKSLVNINDFETHRDYEFLKSCYSDEDNYLKEDISEKDKLKLYSIFHDYAYKVFLEIAEENQNLKTARKENIGK